MIDPISVAVTLTVLGIGVSIGKRRAAGLPPKSICEGCTHGLSFHDPHTNQCHGKAHDKPLHYDGFGNPTAWRTKQCTCRQYVGPVPADRMISSFQLPSSQPPRLEGQ